jgi:uncharacterized protein YndB with AHSA1/START domain
MTTGTMSTRTEGLEFIATRTFDAPRPTVFKAFSECQSLTHWWGPAGWTLPVCEMDFREGGTWFYCMRSSKGELSCGRTTYHEIVEPIRIIASDAFADAEGNVDESMPNMGVTITFTAVDGRTLVENRARFASAEDLQTIVETGMSDGLRETWDRLEDYLAGRAAS